MTEEELEQFEEWVYDCLEEGSLRGDENNAELTENIEQYIDRYTLYDRFPGAEYLAEDAFPIFRRIFYGGLR